MKKDIEYMVTEVGGLESVIYSSDSLKEVAKFLKMNYNIVKRHNCLKIPFRFDGGLVVMEKIDMNADYENPITEFKK